MKVNAPFAIAAATCCHTATAFQNNGIHLHSSLSHRATVASSSSCLLAKKTKNSSSSSSSGGGKGFGAKKDVKYSINDKSYGIKTSSSSSPIEIEVDDDEQSLEEAQSSMTDFFSTYSDWHPLFRNVMNNKNDDQASSSSPLASSFLLPSTDSDSDNNEENIWGITTLENRNPWRLLPAKPTTNSSLEILANFFDEWQQSLLDIPLDNIITGDNDMHFLEEGRRTIAVSRFHVLDAAASESNVDADVDDDSEGREYDWEKELFRTCWSELAHLTSQDEFDTGSLILIPGIATTTTEEEEEVEETNGASLEYVNNFVETNLIRPMRWLGRENDWEIVAMERGSLAVRILYKLSDIPDLSKRDSGGDEKVTF